MIPLARETIETLKAYYGINLYPSQDRFVSCQARVKAFSGGEQGGKSYALSADLTVKHHVGRLFWILGPDYTQTHREFSYFAEWLNKRGGLVKMNTPEKDSWTAVTATGQTVQTKSANDPSKISMESPDGIVITEPGQIGKETISRARGRVAANRGWVSMGGTYEDEHPDYEEVIAELEREGAAFSLPSWENKTKYPGGYNESCQHLDKQGNRNLWCRCDSEILSLLKVYGPTNFLKRIAGRRVRSEALCYNIFTGQYPMVQEYAGNLKFLRAIGAGIDYGFADPSCIEVFGLLGDTWWGLDEFYSDRYTARRFKLELDRLRRLWGIEIFFIPHDKPEVVAEYNELRDAEGASDEDRCAFRQNGDFRNIRSGIAYVFSLFETGRLRISPRQTNLIRELQKYSYRSVEDRNRGEKPIDLNNHAPDALRLHAMGMKDFYQEELLELERQRMEAELYKTSNAGRYYGTVSRAVVGVGADDEERRVC